MALAKTLMIQGTASHVGKSMMTVALRRILRNRGYRVAPFKSQNMSNNSYVTPEGLEVARAQAVQAEACGLEPCVEMSPILLKPESDMRVQAVVMGKPWRNAPCLFDNHYRMVFEPVVLAALQKLRREYEVVVIEGAGSPAEVNLKKRDIVNMRIAQAVRAPVVLVGNIDWGGVFAQFVGTMELLTTSEQKRVKAFLINKFRGSLELLKPGLTWLERRTHRKVLGVVPYLTDLGLAEEDSLPEKDGHRLPAANPNPAKLRAPNINVILRLDRRIRGGDSRLRGNDTGVLLGDLSGGRDDLLIDVVWLPRLSNFTDFDLLARWPKVTLRYLQKPDRHRIPDLIILPGTKSTIADLEFLRKTGLADHLMRCARAGTWIFGVCGGYQMLGEKIFDPGQVESSQKECRGLGLLPVVTHFQSQKKTCRVRGVHLASGVTVQGYEIHMGETRLRRKLKPLFNILERNAHPVNAEPEGVMLETGGPGGTKIFGTYLHGLFENAGFLHEFLNERRLALGLDAQPLEQLPDGVTKDDAVYDQLAQKVESSLDMDFLLKIIREQ